MIIWPGRTMYYKVITASCELNISLLVLEIINACYGGCSQSTVGRNQTVFSSSISFPVKVRFQLTLWFGRLTPKLITKLFAFLGVLDHLEVKKVKLKKQIEIRSNEHLKIEDWRLFLSYEEGYNTFDSVRVSNDFLRKLYGYFKSGGVIFYL